MGLRWGAVVLILAVLALTLAVGLLALSEIAFGDEERNRLRR